MALENITGNESLEELQKLFQQFTSRLKTLDEKKSYTRPEIYQKVRSEYEAKLFELQVLLEEKGAGAQQALEQAIAEKDGLIPKLQEFNDALDELELRTIIGELDETSKEARQNELVTAKDEVETRLAELDEKIIQYQDLLNIKPEAAPLPEPEPEPEPVIVPAAPPRPAAPAMITPVQPVAPAPEPEPAPVAPPPRAEPQPVIPQPKPEPVQEAPVAIPKPAPQPVPVRPPQPLPAPVIPVEVPIAVKVKPSPAPAPASSPAAGAAEPNELDELEKQFASILNSSLGGLEETPPAAVPEPAVPVMAASEPDVSTPAEAVPGDHDGELKCPKCGAFNRADNWYCEKCGNELLNATDLLGGKQ